MGLSARVVGVRLYGGFDMGNGDAVSAGWLAVVSYSRRFVRPPDMV